MENVKSWDCTWEKVHASKNWGRYPHSVLVGFIAKNFYKAPNRKEVRILEIGSGSGANVWYLSREGFDVYGIDGSPSGVQQTNDYLRQDGLSAVMTVGDVVKIDYPDDFFDCVIDFGCTGANDVENTELILSESARVLRKGGLFFSETVAKGCDMGSYEKRIDDCYYNFSAGLFAGLGMWRVIDRQGITEIYGKYLTINSVDFMDWTVNDGEFNVKKWIIICAKA